jgi:arylsulfatase A-like enzyme
MLSKLISRTIMVAALCIAGSIGTSGCRRSEPEAQKAQDAKQEATPTVSATPNIVFILVDTLRADRLGAYGRTPSITPALDAIAKEGMTFGRTVAPAPWTLPSVASIFTSYNPSVHKVTSRDVGSGATADTVVNPLREEFHTLAESLKLLGYSTGGFVANPYLLGRFGFAQGYDEYDTSMTVREDLGSGAAVNEAALTWLRGRERDKPFFLYLHYMDTHGPYRSGPAYLDDLLVEVEKQPNKTALTAEELEELGVLDTIPAACTDKERHRRLRAFREYWAARYEAGVRELDHHVATLRGSLEEMGVWDEAYVILTSDHGEALCEHGLWNHGYSVHHTDLHVPLVLRWPGKIRAGAEASRLVRLIDLMPTVLSQLTLPLPPDIQGVSLIPLIEGGELEEPLAAFSEGVKNGPKQRAMQIRNWKLITTLKTARQQLFDLENDYDEQVDLSAKYPARVASLQGLMREELKSSVQLARQGPSKPVPVPPEQLERLRQLGYVGD